MNEIVRAYSIINNLHSAFDRQTCINVLGNDPTIWGKYDVQCSQNICTFMNLLSPEQRGKFLNWGASIIDKIDNVMAPPSLGIKKEFVGEEETPPATVLPSIDMRRLRGASIKDLSAVTKKLQQIRRGEDVSNVIIPERLPPPTSSPSSASAPPQICSSRRALRAAMSQQAQPPAPTPPTQHLPVQHASHAITAPSRISTGKRRSAPPPPPPIAQAPPASLPPVVSNALPPMSSRRVHQHSQVTVGGMSIHK